MQAQARSDGEKGEPSGATDGSQRLLGWSGDPEQQRRSLKAMDYREVTEAKPQ